MTYEYKEEELTRMFMPWFSNARNYEEKFEDTDTSGSDPVDSAGFIKNQTVLIEFKDSLSPKEVRYEGSKGSSIEKKIRTVLNNLYQNNNDNVTKELNGWNRGQEPHFILVANRLSDNVLSLSKSMLEESSGKWHFGYEIIVWNGSSGETLLYSPPKSVPENLLESIRFPDMPSTALPRSKAMSVNKCIEIMEKKNLKELVDFMVEIVNEYGGKKNGSSNGNINFSFPPKIDRAVIGIWPMESNEENGILVTYWLEGLKRRFGLEDYDDNHLPGVKGPRKGHLGASRYFKTIGEISEFWKIMRNN